MDDEGFRDKVTEVYADIASLGADIAEPLPSYYDTDNPTLVSADRGTILMPVVMTGSFDEAAENVSDVLHVVEEADRADGFRVLMVGDASTAHDNNELAENDLRRGEQIGIPVALVIIVVLFGAIAAALMPIGLSIAAILVALGVAALIDQAFQLILLRHADDHHDRAGGRDRLFPRHYFPLSGGTGPRRGQVCGDRARRATAGRTVLFSGITVVIALCGILIVPFSFFQSLALCAILVVLAALAAALTLLPANLALRGSKINLLPIPFIGKGRTTPSESSEGGFCRLITRVVTQYPVISIIVIGAPMVVATAFYFQIQTGINGVDVFPEDTQTREVSFVIEEKFSFGLVNPTDIVIDGDIDSPPYRKP